MRALLSAENPRAVGSGGSGPVTPRPSGTVTVALRHDGRDRPFLVRVPSDLAGGRAPLLIELHGRGIDPFRFDRLTGFGELAAEEGFVLAMPSAIDEIWNDGRDPKRRGGPDDVGYLIAVIDALCARLSIDDRRVYLVGMSNGAAMAGRFACERADRLAALAQVAGTVAADLAARSRPPCPVPIMQIHGSEDRYAPYGGGSRRGLRAHLIIRRAFEPSIGVDEWAEFWVKANRATEGPELSSVDPDTSVRRWRCPDSPSSEVVFYRVVGGGHTWPGSRVPLPRALLGRTSRSFDASTTIWRFLAGQRRDS